MLHFRSLLASLDLCLFIHLFVLFLLVPPVFPRVRTGLTRDGLAIRLGRGGDTHRLLARNFTRPTRALGRQDGADSGEPRGVVEGVGLWRDFDCELEVCGGQRAGSGRVVGLIKSSKCEQRATSNERRTTRDEDECGQQMRKRVREERKRTRRGKEMSISRSFARGGRTTYSELARMVQAG